MDNRNKYNLKLPSLSVRQQSEEAEDHERDEISQQDRVSDGLLLNILPSYQMYQSTISKNLTPMDDSRTNPPTYELTPQSSTASNGSTDYFGSNSIPTSPAREHDINPMDLVAAVEGLAVNGVDNTRWDDTILANAHKLKRLTSINKELSKSLTIQILLTESIGQVGKAPTIIDPLSLELKQGDLIYGYILVTNKTAEDIPFDMFSVVLEGSVTFGNTVKNSVVQPPSHVVRFLTMFDFNASWNDACLDRLTTDHNNPHIPINEIDPIDHTHVNFSGQKILKPGIVYKKYFTFRMPEKLLDSSCENGLLNHLQIPSTLGVSKSEVISALRQKWKETGETELSTPKIEEPKNNNTHHASVQNKTRYASLVNDFAFADSSIDFSISARIIGKASEYDRLFTRKALPHLDPAGDEYVVANEAYCYLRVVGTTGPLYELNRPMMYQEAKLISTNLVNTIKEKIALGKELYSAQALSLSSSGNGSTSMLGSSANHLTSSQSQNSTNGTRSPFMHSRNNSFENFLSPVTSAEAGSASSDSPALHPTQSASDLAKMEQKYRSKSGRLTPTTLATRDDKYEVFHPYKKKSVFGASKVIGLIAFSTPKTEYTVDYIPLKQFRRSKRIPLTKITIPIEITFVSSEKSGAGLPDFKKVSVELVALTVKSKGLPIPLAFHADMLFENKTRGSNNFDLVTVKPFQRYAIEMQKLIKSVGVEAMEIDRDLLQNIKCMANLSTKYDHFKLPTASLRNVGVIYDSLSLVPWESETIGGTSIGGAGATDDQVRHFKKFNVEVDLADAVLPQSASPDYCLVPSFQSCLLARIYYLIIHLKCPNGDKISLRVPVSIQRN